MTLTDRYDGLSFDQEQEFRAERNLARFAGSMIDETAAGLTFVVSMTNESADAMQVCLFPGDLRDKDEILGVLGKNIAGIVGSNIANLKVRTSSNMPHAQRFFVRNPTRITEMQISVDSESQLSNAIEITQSSPFRKLGSQVIVPKNSQRSGDANSKLVNIPLKNLQLDDQTQLFATIGAGRTVEITFFIGASRNDAYLLHEAAKIAMGK